MGKSQLHELSKLYSKKVLTTKEKKRKAYLIELQQDEREQKIYNRIGYSY